jgi:hypothetical protein
LLRAEQVDPFGFRLNRTNCKVSTEGFTPVLALERGNAAAAPEKSQAAMDSGTEPGSMVELSEDEQKAAGVQVYEVATEGLE